MLKQNNGIAMVIALIVVVMVVAFCAAYMQITINQNKTLTSSINYATSSEAVLAGFDMSRVVLANGHSNGWDDELVSCNTNIGTPSAYVLTVPTSTSGFQWARNIAYNGGYFSATIIDNNDGDSNLLNDNDDMVTLNVISTMPDGSVSEVQALVRFKPPVFAPETAVLCGGAMSLGGSSLVTGTNGSIYAAGCVTISGSAGCAQDVYSAQTITGGDPAKNHSGAAAPDLPVINPSSYSAYADYELRTNGDVWSKSTNSVIGTADKTTAVAGWKYDSAKKDWDNDGTPLNGTFYVVDGNLKLTGNVGTTAVPWRATLLVNGESSSTGKVEFKGTGGAGTNMVPDDVGHDSYGIILLAQNNVDIGGNFGSSGGLIATHEQIKLSGTANINGALVAESYTLGVDGVSVDEGGNANITYNGGITTILSAGDSYILIKGFKRIR
jgi:hypothetical protein